MICSICPRKCNVDLNNKSGFCGKLGEEVKVAKVMRHNWEEPIISGKKGSGAIFFSFCNLKCVYCQNFKISHLGEGKKISVMELANIFKKLEDSNVENINLVTPTHFTTQIIDALKLYKPKVPIVWNTSGYEDINTLEMLKGYVDIFLFDFKYFSNEKAKLYSNAPNYFNVCFNALKKAREIVPEDKIENGIMKTGIIVRHLVLPNNYNDSINIFDALFNNFGNEMFVSVMSQFTPFYKALEIKELNTKLKPLEYKKVLSHIKKLGFKNGFIQELSSASCNYTPNFTESSFYEL